MSLVIDNIGLLVTNDPALGDGPLGLVRDASVVITDAVVESVGARGQIADDRLDAEGRCVMPGFVDSHTHLVFAGDRAEEFTSRMAGVPYDGGGIRTTTEATRRASDDELRALISARLEEAHRAGTTTIEIKSGYGLDVVDEARCLRIAAEHTTETTFLGAHVVPTEFAGRADAYVELVCGAMLEAAAPDARWIDAFCETGAFDVDQCRAVLEAGRDAGLGLRLHANQLGHGPGVRLGVEIGVRVGRPLHVPHRRRHRPAGRERHRRDLPPGDGLLDPPAVSRRAAGHRPRRHAWPSPRTATRARATPRRSRSASPSRFGTWG